MIFRKNTVVLLLALSLIILGTLTEAAEKKRFSPAPLNEDFVKQTNELMTKKRSERGRSGYRHSPVDLSHLKDADYSGFLRALPQGRNLPSRFDLRDVNGKSFVTPVKAQGPYGTCWTFSAMGSLESSYLKAKGRTLDLSEMHLATFAFRNKRGFAFDSRGNDILNSGGFDNISIAMLARWAGAVDERDAPYEERIPEKAEPADYRNKIHLQHAFQMNLQFFLEDRKHPSNEVRKALTMEHGAISAAFHSLSETTAYNAATAAWCNDKRKTTDDTDHAILLIGWDDEYSRKNFNEATRPNVDGAWLVKNSWGADWGNGGYFWLSYGDTTLFDGTVYIGDEAGNYDSIYSYDALGWCRSIGNPNGGAGTLSMANIFKAAADEVLKAVSFYTTEGGAKYEISIYENLSNGANPTSGTIVHTQKGEETFAGYHTVKLQKNVEIKSGTSFSVVLKMTTPKYKYPLAVEAKVGNYSSQFAVQKGESFFSHDGDVWVDGTSKEMPFFANACIKAFTTTMKGGPEPANPEPADPKPAEPINPADPSPAAPEVPNPTDPTNPPDPPPMDPEAPNPVDPAAPPPADPEMPDPINPTDPLPTGPEVPNPTDPTNPEDPEDIPLDPELIDPSPEPALEPDVPIDPSEPGLADLPNKKVVSEAYRYWLREAKETGDGYRITFTGYINATDGRITDVKPHMTNVRGAAAFVEEEKRPDTPSGMILYTLHITGRADDIKGVALRGITYKQSGAAYKQLFPQPILLTGPAGTDSGTDEEGGSCATASFSSLLLLSLAFCLRRR